MQANNHRYIMCLGSLYHVKGCLNDYGNLFIITVYRVDFNYFIYSQVRQKAIQKKVINEFFLSSNHNTGQLCWDLFSQNFRSCP